MKTTTITLMLAIALCFASCGSGSTNDSAEAANDSNEAKLEDREENEVRDSATAVPVSVNEYDTKFVVEAANGGLMEVQAGTMAAQQATMPRVKTFAEMIVRDHNTANSELKQLAASKNITIPDSVGGEHKDHMKRLTEKKAAEFDKTYMAMMVDDHQDDVSKFEDAARNASDPDIKAFATRQLPILKAHLDSAKALNDMVRKRK